VVSGSRLLTRPLAPVTRRVPSATGCRTQRATGCGTQGKGWTAFSRVDPAASDAPYPACPTRSLFGLLCPGCGTLTALHALMHGRVASALSANALAVLAVPMMAMAVVAVTRTAVRGQRLEMPRLPLLTPASAAVVLVTWTVLRNV
jgi:hypothetical protein